ncbi:TIGR03618 family F420-dependent PPOX class oxidoreductase [Actinomycetospora sp. NBRC 106378]|jgi:PPOX class probable F420-dependent enzyme|uniref:TIGR03618 family F420-dependent PPOX class oxidoreductase n=1 Tax=Actinomycetospora sp. NBRC 106378 TaxID=3032208 RepID=UPI0024A4731B|nr:TIGR03618 family F420-dependent PPOX class oxidoreductase [Actinomycetospora sp. NBRC 106378]GLZ56299.1 PPOX class F420-dependent enzyme [Actinomycetospora sp. NBRC 106378]
MDVAEFGALAAEEQGLVVVSTVRADGSIQSSVVNAGVMAHPVTGQDVLAYVTYGRAKLGNLRRRPWTAVTARVGWRWGTVEGSVEIAGPDDPLPGVDDVPALLRAVFAAAGGTHDDWDEFDAVMARDRRAAVLVTPTRVYSN